MTSTLRAEAHHPPCVLESAGFCTEHSAKSRSIGYEEERSPTLRAGVVPAAMILDNHPTDSRIKICEDNIVPTIPARAGTGGGNVPLLLEVPYTLKVRCGGGNGGKGALIQTDKSATIACNNDQTLFVPKAYGVCAKDSNSMKSDNPHSGFYEADTSRTIDTSNQSPNKNQGGIVVLEGNGSRPSHHGDGYSESETMYTLNCTENHAVSYGIDRASFNQGKNALYNFAVEEEIEPTIVAKGCGCPVDTSRHARSTDRGDSRDPGAVAQPASFYPQMKAESQCYRDDGISNTLVNGTNPGFQNGVVYSTSKASYHTIAEEECANTLVASDYKDPPVVNDSTAEVEYIVRRLTPQECALLQGMPTWWCDGLESENPTDGEIDRWEEIFETYRKATGSSAKPKTRSSVIKWLKNPYSDSAAYKMWGNGIAMPCGYFVLAAIAENHSS